MTITGTISPYQLFNFLNKKTITSNKKRNKKITGRFFNYLHFSKFQFYNRYVWFFRNDLLNTNVNADSFFVL